MNIIGFKMNYQNCYFRNEFTENILTAGMQMHIRERCLTASQNYTRFINIKTCRMKERTYD